MDDHADAVELSADGPVGYVTINRPEKRNALTRAMSARIREHITTHEQDPAIRVVVLRGQPGAFCAGTDLQSLAGQDPSARGLGGDNLFEDGFADFGWLEDYAVPVIAAVDGVAVGLGAELALQADLRVVTERARLLWNFPARGLVADTGAGTWKLPRLIGEGQASLLLLTGRPLEGEEAHRIGFAEVFASSADLDATVGELAGQIASLAPLSIRWTKQLLTAGRANSPRAHRLQTMRVLEACFRTADHHEGITSFLERRDAVFVGR